MTHTPEEIRAMLAAAQAAGFTKDDCEIQPYKRYDKWICIGPIRVDNDDVPTGFGPAVASLVTCALTALPELLAEVERLREWIQEFADEPCEYGDDCPRFAKLKHGTCLNCKARAALITYKDATS